MKWFLLFILNRVYYYSPLLSVYKAIKYVIHYVTETTEIYRLCSTPEPRVDHTIVYRIEKSILYSNQLTFESAELQRGPADINPLVESITIKKRFPVPERVSAIQVLRNSLMSISASYQLIQEVTEQASTPYDTENPTHEQKLIKLWHQMKPNVPLEARRSDQWTEIGFQGTNPATDFRGMGVQGLDDLLYYAETHPDIVQSNLQHASHPVAWYPYAIVGINITQFSVTLLKTKKLQMYLYEHGTDMTTYQEFYCKFNDFWITHEPTLTVMDFEASFKKFKKIIELELASQRIAPLSLLLKRKEYLLDDVLLDDDTIPLLRQRNK
ncbi:ELMO/CED-12 family-domain-containing protein [Pilobolus umbonatus]|nr:ELMO/CED-12 family-domain-containing protein [Pilobolus umbonatus]